MGKAVEKDKNTFIIKIGVDDGFGRSREKEEKKISKAEMSRIMNTIMDSVEEARDGGQDEYARDTENAFANFERISSWTKIQREKVLMVYLMKHIDGIASYLRGHKSQREDVTGRLTDAIVYLCILWGMIDKGGKNGRTCKDN